MDRGKGIVSGNYLETIAVNTRNLTNKKSGDTTSGNIVRKDYIFSSVLKDFNRLLSYGGRTLPDQIGYDSEFATIRESSGPLIPFSSSTINQFALNGASPYKQTVSSASLLEQSFFEESVFNRMFEHTPAGVYLECNGAIVMCNRRFSELLCSPADKVVGKSAFALLGVNAESITYVQNQCGHTRSSEQAEFSVKVNLKRGAVRWLNCTINCFVWDTFRLAFGSITDISEQVQNHLTLKAAKEKIQKLSLQLIGAREMERKRVALELHDGISQNLSAIKLNIEQYIAVMDKPRSGEPDLKDTSGLGNRLVRSMQNTIEEIRRIAVDLSPSMLDDLGLVQTIHWFCREFQSIHNRVKIQKNITISEADIPGPLKIVIYRIVQEALNNVSKHSNATQVHVELVVVPKGLRLSIRDNGDGIREKYSRRDNPRMGGMGLRSMQERAYSTGALFKIRSVLGKGTGVHVLWPHVKIEKLRRQAVIDYVSGERGYAV